MTEITAVDVDHPGTFIREELEARGWSQRDLAYILGVLEQSINPILSGKRGISAGMAKALGDAFDVPAEFFANLQRAYDLASAREPDQGVALRGRVQEQFPLREMIKRGWIQDGGPDVLQDQLTRFFEVNRFSQIPHLAHAGKKTSYDKIPPMQLAWLFRVRQIAKSMVTPKYSEKSLKAAVATLEQLRGEPEDVRRVPRILHECGVRYILVEGLLGGKIDGVCFWLNANAPVIGMSLRLDRIDNFWFVLRHEIEHVLRKHSLNKEIIDVEIEQPSDSVPDQEKEANDAAANFCVPRDSMESFYLRKNPFFYEKDVIGFAQRMGAHPGIVVGQIQWMTGKLDYLRRHQVKTRDHVIPSAMVDGWGHAAPVNAGDE